MHWPDHRFLSWPAQRIEQRPGLSIPRRCGTTPEHPERFAAEIRAEATTAEAAVRDADVVVTGTLSLDLVLRGAWLKPRTHVNAVGWRGARGARVEGVVAAKLVYDRLEL
jgi:ornithine cyclodeaminase/alanine dehydrogenase-like protein (mu-crystallin family)